VGKYPPFRLRRVKVHPALADASPLRPEKLRGVDVFVVREPTGGLYFGRKSRETVPGGHLKVTDALECHDYEIRRILELAFRLARGRRRVVTSVDKANVLGHVAAVAADRD
jgi:3-isopropylmalate dehydrogenase